MHMTPVSALPNMRYTRALAYIELGQFEGKPFNPLALPPGTREPLAPNARSMAAYAWWQLLWMRCGRPY